MEVAFWIFVAFVGSLAVAGFLLARAGVGDDL